MEEEFQSLMERGGELFELSRKYGSGEPFDSDDDKDEDEDEDGGIVGVIRNDEENQIPVAQPITDYNIIIDVLPSVTINDLHEIAKRMVAARFGKECSHVYSSFRREFLEESLSRGSTIQLLNFADVVAIRSRSVEWLFKMRSWILADEIVDRQSG
ncbi:hypothetical protein SO802_029926 [Lithocarpus litseifolius]|uniref:Uncharacterized protein n=1 Tax=Lithocarpus litseifolius TaxID=425828 RepID=A0AAW2BX27_9ROSI